MIGEVTREEVNEIFTQMFGKDKLELAKKAFEASFSLNSQRLKRQVIDEIKNEIVSKDLLQAEFKAHQAQMRQEMNEIKAELKQDIAEVQAGLKQKIVGVRTNLGQKVSALKVNMTDIKISIIKWVVGIQVATIGVLVAIMKF